MFHPLSCNDSFTPLFPLFACLASVSDFTSHFRLHGCERSACTLAELAFRGSLCIWTTIFQMYGILMGEGISKVVKDHHWAPQTHCFRWKYRRYGTISHNGKRHFFGVFFFCLMPLYDTSQQEALTSCYLWITHKQTAPNGLLAG